MNELNPHVTMIIAVGLSLTFVTLAVVTAILQTIQAMS